MDRRRTARPQLQPLDIDGVRTVIVGTIAWAVGLLGSLLAYDELSAGGNGWWLWTCVAGVGLGLCGLAYCLRRRRLRRAARATVQNRSSSS